MNILKTSIVIPTYKENDNIKIIIPLIYNYLSNKKFIFEVIIIDDNSNDGIINTIKNLKKKFENLRIFVRRNKIRDLSLSCFL
jgi:dolichol-phosphate mannosyltransferase